MHEVIIENVGSVYYGSDEAMAEEKYRAYAGQYKPFGCDWFAHCTWIEDNDIREEFQDPNGPEE